MILIFVARREPPTLGLGVVRERRLEEKCLALHHKSETVLPRSHDVGHGEGLAKNLFSAAIHSVLTLIKRFLFAEDLEILIGGIVKNGGRKRKPLYQGPVGSSNHRAAHAGFNKARID